MEFERVDTVAGNAEMTQFKRLARAHQSKWRETKKYKAGSHPMRPVSGSKPRELGSRLDLKTAIDEGHNFLNSDIREAVAYRLGDPQKYQMLNEDRLHCDLLSSMPMCFNLFGWLHEQKDLTGSAVREWWPDLPISASVDTVNFEWSPGRKDKSYLGNCSAFDVAFTFKFDDKTSGVIGVETKYHEHCKWEPQPKDDKLIHYKLICEKSGVFKRNALEEIIGKDLQQIWLDHLLALSMLQHESSQWSYAKLVLICPKKNISFVQAAERYSELLSIPATFEFKTIESVVDSQIFPKQLRKDFEERYLW